MLLCLGEAVFCVVHMVWYWGRSIGIPGFEREGRAGQGKDGREVRGRRGLTVSRM